MHRYDIGGLLSVMCARHSSHPPAPAVVKCREVSEMKALRHDYAPE